jgi:hypothetical protein
MNARYKISAVRVSRMTVTAADLGLHLRWEGVRYIVPRPSAPAGVLRMFPLHRCTREVGEVEPPELRLRNGLLLLITLGQAGKHDGVEIDI